MINPILGLGDRRGLSGKPTWGDLVWPGKFGVAQVSLTVSPWHIYFLPVINVQVRSQNRRKARGQHLVQARAQD